jgi:hypothetical protein
MGDGDAGHELLVARAWLDVRLMRMMIGWTGLGLQAAVRTGRARIDCDCDYGIVCRFVALGGIELIGGCGMKWWLRW